MSSQIFSKFIVRFKENEDAKPKQLEKPIRE